MEWACRLITSPEREPWWCVPRHSKGKPHRFEGGDSFLCSRRTDQDRRYSAARRAGAWTGTEIHGDKRGRSSTPYMADGPASQSVSKGCVPIRAISNPVCQACVVLEFDNDAPPTIALLRSCPQCKDAVEKERQTQNPQETSGEEKDRAATSWLQCLLMEGTNSD